MEMNEYVFPPDYDVESTGGGVAIAMKAKAASKPLEAAGFLQWLPSVGENKHIFGSAYS